MILFFRKTPESGRFLARQPFYIFQRTLARCVLSPWPRAFLSLASRGSDLEKSVLGLGLERCVLDSTSANNNLPKDRLAGQAGDMLVSRTGDLRFKTRADEIGQKVGYGSSSGAVFSVCTSR